MAKKNTTHEREHPESSTLKDALLSASPLVGVDWKIPALDMGYEDRLFRLAHVRALLPSGNAIDEKTTHDVTLENYIRLALQAAGDQGNLDRFLSEVGDVLETADPESAASLAQQVFWIWAPAAEVAGLYHHKLALEDAAFKALLPEEYDKICEEYDKAALEAEDGILSRMQKQMRDTLGISLDPGVSFELSARPKSNYSVWRKLRSEDRQTADIFDLLGFRVLINAGNDETLAVDQCYVAMAAIAAEFESDKSRLKDYIEKPKASGYQSLHLTLYTPAGMPFELQVRTHEMHILAESDNALAHQGYEATFKETPGKIQKRFEKVPKLYHWRNEATQYIREHDGSTDGFLGDDILFFRPDGNLYRTASSGTVLDASFRIHSRRALRTGAVNVNGKLSGFTAPVGHGDVVEVEYVDDYPTEAVRFDNMHGLVRTAYARRAVERGKRDALSDEYRQMGRGVVLAMVGDIGINDPLAVLDDVDRRKLADKAGLPSFDALLELIGVGDENGKPTRVAQWILERCGMGKELPPRDKEKSLAALKNTEVLRWLEVPSVSGVPECKIGGCCSEKIHYGDPVLVRPSMVDRILKVHLVSCKNIRDLSDTLVCSWAERQE